jgi:diguanylate cyclase (GGDEF)-like protein
LTLAAGAVLVVGFLVGFAVVIRMSEAGSRRALAERFETRASLTASFAQNFVDDLAGRERSQAERRLAGADIDPAAFEEVVRSFGFGAAVLLDGTGHLLQVYPAKPELIGRDMTVQYAHLRMAVAGRVGVSQVVPSAAAGIPVTAVAAPYASAVGPRVFSGAFTPALTPLGTYLNSIVPVRGGAAYLVDRSGHLLAASRGTKFPAKALGTLTPGVADHSRWRVPTTVAVANTPVMPWRVVLTAPTAALYAPVAVGRWAPWALWLALGGAALVALVLVARLDRARAQAAATARTDALTGLPNRRAMEELLNRAVALSKRHGVPLAALMVDIDRFKDVNDSLGHETGDRVLRATAGAMASAVREEDIAGRWGGEEFLVLLPHTDEGAATNLAERIRAAIAAVSMPERAGLRVTASIGVSVIGPEGTAALVGDADDALYAAKANGRNRIEVQRPLARPAGSRVR